MCLDRIFLKFQLYGAVLVFLCLNLRFCRLGQPCHHFCVCVVLKLDSFTVHCNVHVVDLLVPGSLKFRVGAHPIGDAKAKKDVVQDEMVLPM